MKWIELEGGEIIKKREAPLILEDDLGMPSPFIFFQLHVYIQQGLEDPFLIDFTSFTPGIDALKLDYEMAVGLQAVEQYYAEAQIRAAWDDMELKRKDAKNKK